MLAHGSAEGPFGLYATTLMRLLKWLLFELKEGEDRARKNTVAVAKLNTSD